MPPPPKKKQKKQQQQQKTHTHSNTQGSNRPSCDGDLCPLLQQKTFWASHRMRTFQCFGSESGRIRIIWPDPDPHQEALIWIRVPKKNRDKLAYKSTKIIKIYIF